MPSRMSFIKLEWRMALETSVFKIEYFANATLDTCFENRYAMADVSILFEYWFCHGDSICHAI